MQGGREGHRVGVLIGCARLRPEESNAEVGEGEPCQGLWAVGVQGLSTARVQSA